MMGEIIAGTVAALPALYGLWCWVRRGINARRTAAWVRETHPDAWESLHPLAKRHPRAGVEVLISQKRISGPEVKRYQVVEDRLEIHAWAGLFVSAFLLLAMLAVKYAWHFAR